MKHFVRLACFLLIASTQLIYSKDVLHELTCHEDTKDVYCSSDAGSSLSTEHHHCDCLQLSLPPFCHELSKQLCCREQLSCRVSTACCDDPLVRFSSDVFSGALLFPEG